MIAIALALLAAGRVVTLDEAVQAARERQPQLRQARANTEAAGARAQQSLAPLLPQVTAIAGYQRTTANGINRPGSGSASAGNGSSWDTVNSFTDSIQASQLIFDFGAGTNRWRSAKALADAQAANERAVVLQVDYNVRAAYFDTRANQALVQVARENLENLQRHLAQIEGFVQAGTHPEIDLLQAKTDAANARVQLINAENAYETSKVTLNAAMGVLGPTDYDISDESLAAVQGEDTDIAPLLDEATKSRPEVENIEKLVRADELTVRSVEGNYWPSLSATAGVTP